MDVRNFTVRDRLQGYEFTDEQELTLTLELLNRVEKDIDELRGKRSREGFSEYVALAGFAAVVFLLLNELGKLLEIPFSNVTMVLLAGLLLMKIPWAMYQLLAIDVVTAQPPEKGRFFWSNDLFFEQRIAGVFQLILFVGCATVVFFLHLPFWISASTGLAFLLYVFILGLVSVFSFRKKPLSRETTRKSIMISTPTLFIFMTAVSLFGLIPRMKLPIGLETSSYAIAGLLLAMVFFIDTLIRLSTPSMLLRKLERLRYDIIFLKADLKDAWTRYEVIAIGHDISEELRADMDEIIRSFNTIDYGQSQKERALSAYEEELGRLETDHKIRALTDSDFVNLQPHKAELFKHVATVKKLFADLQPRLDKLAKDVHEISRSTQEWNRAEEYHKDIVSRLAAIDDTDEKIQKRAVEADEKLKRLLLPEAKQTD
jgi:hypothetical protein